MKCSKIFYCYTSKFVWISLLTSTLLLVLLSGNTASANEPIRRCYDIQLVFARGSGEPLEGKNYTGFRDEIKERLQLGDISVDAYELGSNRGYKGYAYPAEKVNDDKLFTTGLSAQSSSGYKNTVYGMSVKTGVTELSYYLIDTAARCPSTKFVLGGYSQGAQVMGQVLPVLPQSIANKIIFVALFGDPKLYLPEGEGIHPSACRNQDFSNWRRIVPNCKTDDGTLDARKPYIPNYFLNKVGLWCNNQDWICGSSKNPLNNSGHDRYAVDGGAIDDAAREISIKINRQRGIIPNLPPSQLGLSLLSKPDMPLHGPDVVMIIDRNGQNEVRFRLRVQAAMQNAEKYWRQGGRVAFVTLCSANLQQTKYNSSGLVGNSNSERERLDYFVSMNQYCGTTHIDRTYALAMTTALDSVQWRVGAEKAALLMSEYSPRNPNEPMLRDYIATRAAEIDPVNIYSLVESGGDISFLQEIADATAGRVFTYNGDEDIIISAEDTADRILTRPIIRFRGDEHTTTVNEPIILSAWSSLDEVDEHRTYRWDFEGDGIWDESTTVPTVAAHYASEGTRLAQVEVTGSDGGKASMTTYVRVDAALPEIISQLEPPADVRYKIISTNNGMSTARIFWIPDSSVYKYVISVGGIHLGMLDNSRATIDLTDIDRSHNTVISLQAMDEAFNLGTKSSVEIPASIPIIAADKSSHTAVIDKVSTVAAVGGAVDDNIQEKNKSLMAQAAGGQNEEQGKRTIHILVTVGAVLVSVLVGILSYIRYKRRQSNSN